MKPATCITLCLSTVLALAASCTGTGIKEGRPVGLVVLDPGHFHASLILKTPLEGVSTTVEVYAPQGAEANRFLAEVDSYNTRPDNPTAWSTEVYPGGDYLERMLSGANGDVVVLAGNNRKKTEYILKSVNSGRNVLSDKPMAIDAEDFGMLVEACRGAADKGVLVYEMMTERYDVLNIVARELINDGALFGGILPGTAAEPAIEMRSVHNFFKTVSGVPLIRPAWYYDVGQQGEGIADVTTHLVDLAAWWAFPDEPVRYPADVEVADAGHRPTLISPEEFTRSTGEEAFPPFLEKYVNGGVLEVMANGSLVFSMKGVHVGMEVVWNYSSPDGGDSFSALVKGRRAWLEMVQDASTGFVKQLCVRPAPGTGSDDFARRLAAGIDALRGEYPFLSAAEKGSGLWLIDIPSEARTGHEAHFGAVTEKFLGYLREGNIPEWESENMLSKYYITTRAVEIANSK